MKLTYVAHLLEISLIVFLLLYIFVLSPALNHSPEANNLNVSNQSADSPPKLLFEISSPDDVVNDLTSIGCKLIPASTEGTRMESVIVVSSYIDFREIAYGVNTVYYSIVDYGSSSAIFCYVLQNDMPVAFKFSEAPETVSKIGTAIQIQSVVRSAEGLITVYVQNVGDSDVVLSTLYVDGVLNTPTSIEVPVGTSVASLDESPLVQANTAMIEVSGDYTGYGQLTIKVVTADGTFIELKKVFVG